MNPWIYSTPNVETILSNHGRVQCSGANAARGRIQPQASRHVLARTDSNLAMTDQSRRTNDNDILRYQQEPAHQPLQTICCMSARPVACLQICNERQMRTDDGKTPGTSPRIVACNASKTFLDLSHVCNLAMTDQQMRTNDGKIRATRPRSKHRTRPIHFLHGCLPCHAPRICQ